MWRGDTSKVGANTAKISRDVRKPLTCKSMFYFIFLWACSKLFRRLHSTAKHVYQSKTSIKQVNYSLVYVSK